MDLKQRYMKHGIWVFALVFSNLALSRAQELNLETCLRMADTANVNIVNSRLEVEKNKKQISAYLSARLPKISIVGDYKYNAIIPGQLVPAQFFGGPPGTYATVAFGVPYNLSTTAQLQQILYNPQVNYGINTLKIQQEVVEIQEVITSRDSKHQVAATYFNLQAAYKQLQFIDSNLTNMDRLVTNLEAMSKQKMVLQTEVDKLKIQRLNLVNSKQGLEATIDQLESLLKIMIGLPDDQKITLASDVLMQQTILVDNGSVSYPEVDLINAQKRMNEEERNGTNMSYLPSLSFYAGYNYTYNMQPKDNVRKGIESAFLGLRLDWTLFDGLEKMNKQKVNKINQMKLENQEEYIKEQLDIQTANAKRQIDIQKSSLDIAQEQLVLAQNVYRQSELQYAEGVISSNDLITAENGLQEAQTNVVLAYVKLRQAELDYLKAIGKIQ